MGKQKNKRARARRSKQTTQAAKHRELVVREDGQAYARVLKLLGNGRLQALCDDGQERTCRIRGSMIRKVWIRTGDAVLVSLRSYGDDDQYDPDKADVIHRYNAEEVVSLERMGELKLAIAADAVDDANFVRFASESESSLSDDDVDAI
jgi:translation initiation factor 1A